MALGYTCTTRVDHLGRLPVPLKRAARIKGNPTEIDL